MIQNETHGRLKLKVIRDSRSREEDEEEAMKINYQKWTDEKLREQMKENKIEMSKTYAMFGMAVAKQKDNAPRGAAGKDSTGGLRRNLRKSNARILTVLRERRK